MSDLMDWSEKDTILPPPLTASGEDDQLILELLKEEEAGETQRLSRAEMAKKVFEARALQVLGGGNIFAGRFFSMPEVKQAAVELRKAVGGLYAQILDDFILDNRAKFLSCPK